MIYLNISFIYRKKLKKKKKKKKKKKTKKKKFYPKLSNFFLFSSIK